ncbi:hypothetical protein EDC01DRAFT_658188, partial [Geopyxis carbonaria]
MSQVSYYVFFCLLSCLFVHHLPSNMLFYSSATKYWTSIFAMHTYFWLAMNKPSISKSM